MLFVLVLGLSVLWVAMDALFHRVMYFLGSGILLNGVDKEVGLIRVVNYAVDDHGIEKKDCSVMPESVPVALECLFRLYSLISSIL